MTPRAGVSGTTLEQDIKQEARRLGFILAGVTTPEAPPHASFFEAWLGHGRHGQMDYLATTRSRTRRGNPRTIMPDCRSILVLAMPYSNPGKVTPIARRSEKARTHGRLAAYAWGRDYHEVIPARLRALVAFIEERAGRSISSRSYTDTGPILERDLAQRAGLGWIGKNTCLINPGVGSYFLLAEILMDLELRSDPAFESDHCGSCTRCIQACPTECILPDRSIDARRCISYLTIELKSGIPSVLRAKMGEWLFGCDICQLVCPWNRFAPPQGEAALAATPAAAMLDPVEQLALSAEDFNQQTRGSPWRRPKYQGHLRNAVVVAGNIAGTEAILPLQNLAAHADPMIKEHAAWALARVAERKATND